MPRLYRLGPRHLIAPPPRADMAGLSSEEVYQNLEPSLAELPREYLNTRYVEPAGATVVSPATGAALQSFLDTTWNPSAGPVVIRLTPGVQYGPLRIPSRANPAGHWTILRPTSLGLLPAPGTRIGREVGASLPRIDLNRPNDASSFAAISFAAAASYVRFVGIGIGLTEVDVEGDGGSLDGTRVFPCTALVRLFADSAWTTEAEMPHHVIVDRCVIEGAYKALVRKGFQIQANYVGIVDSWIGEIHEGSDANAAAVFAGRCIKVVNNHLDASGENILFGGAPPIESTTDDALEELVRPRDIEIRRNWLYTPLKYKKNTTEAFAAAYLIRGAFQADAVDPATGVVTEAAGAFGSYATGDHWLKVVSPGGATRYVEIASSTATTITPVAGATPATTADTLSVVRTYAWINKNAGESKNALRALWEGNVFENSWVGGQTGYGLSIKTDNQSGAFDATTSADHTVRHNWIKNVCIGMLVTGDVGAAASPGIPSHAIHVKNNLVTDLCSGINQASDGTCFQLGGDLHDAWFEDTTFVISDAGTGQTATCESGGKSGASGATIIALRDGLFRNVIASRGGGGSKAGVYGGGTSEGNNTIDLSYPGTVWDRFYLVRRSAGTTAAYPPGVQVVPSRAAVGFRTPRDGSEDPLDWSIPAGPYVGAGCNVATLARFIAGVRG